MDWNGDGKQDLISGDTNGDVWLFVNTGTAQNPVLAAGEKMKADGKEIQASRTIYERDDKGGLLKDANGKYVTSTKTGSNPLAKIYSKINIADCNDDGLPDLLVGHDRDIIFYKNIGTRKAPELAAPVKVEIPEGNFPMRSSPLVVDWNGDGVKDLMTGAESGNIRFYHNAGTNADPVLAKGVEIILTAGEGFDKSYRRRIDVVDWNNDGKLDILAGEYHSDTKEGKRVSTGNVWLFLGK